MASTRSKGDRHYLVATLQMTGSSPGRKQVKLALRLDDTIQGRIKEA